MAFSAEVVQTIKEAGRETSGDLPDTRNLLRERLEYLPGDNTILRYLKEDGTYKPRKNGKGVRKGARKYDFDKDQLLQMRKDYREHGPNPVRAFLKAGNFDANEYEAGWKMLGFDPEMLSAEDVRVAGRKSIDTDCWGIAPDLA